MGQMFSRVRTSTTKAVGSAWGCFRAGLRNAQENDPWDECSGQALEMRTRELDRDQFGNRKISKTANGHPNMQAEQDPHNEATSEWGRFIARAGLRKVHENVPWGEGSGQALEIDRDQFAKTENGLPNMQVEQDPYNNSKRNMVSTRTTRN